MDALVLPAAVDALGPRPAALFSSPTFNASTEPAESYSAFVSKEIQARTDAKKILEELDSNDPKYTEQKSKEALRRMLWGMQISGLYPAECARDFS